MHTGTKIDKNINAGTNNQPWKIRGLPNIDTLMYATICLKNEKAGIFKEFVPQRYCRKGTIFHPLSEEWIIQDDLSCKPEKPCAVSRSDKLWKGTHCKKNGNKHNEGLSIKPSWHSEMFVS